MKASFPILMYFLKNKVEWHSNTFNQVVINLIDQLISLIKLLKFKQVFFTSIKFRK